MVIQAPNDRPQWYSSGGIHCFTQGRPLRNTANFSLPLPQPELWTSFSGENLIMSFTLKHFPKHMALAVALSTGSVFALSGVIAEPVQAEKKKKDKKSGKKQYSEAFVGAYNPINDARKVEGADIGSIVAMLPGLIAVSQSADERFVTGNTVYSVGQQAADQKLQLDGLKMMLDSGQVEAGKLGQFNFLGYQLARDLEDHDISRTLLQGAIDNNFVSGDLNSDVMKIEMSETYFRENRFKEGLQVLDAEIQARAAAGRPVTERIFSRGVSVGYRNEVTPEIYSLVNRWVTAYPATKNWRDAVNITRQLNDYGVQETLDLLRLAFKVDALKESIEYIDYVDAADARRLPQEVQTVIQAGYSSGRISRDDAYLAESLRLAKSRISADKAELPALARDARAASARLRTVLAAGDAFLNYGDNAKAEEFYSKALNMAGVDRAQTLTRLGIAQAELGKFADAKSSFDQVQGSRAHIAQLWSTYVDTKMVTPTPPAIAASPAS